MTKDTDDALAVSSQSSIAAKTDQSADKQTPDKQKSETSKDIMVDIKGAVKKPAVYKVSSHARVNDVVALAGGLTDQADIKSINLAQKVTDEMTIYVASIGEDVTASEVIQAEQGEATTTDKVNINTADLAKLQTLRGVGAKRAQDIIDYREQNGPFKTPEDLGNVKGFGEKTIEKLKESITVD
ncbi:ComEA family DNA-binding protein [Lactococcus raffinolactis]|nr:ComEA family DNA-binding protein [Lactococcus raffinolactis]QIW61781.1 ComEA family DNA-binding protein [Lactococcus raffinolactis]